MSSQDPTIVRPLGPTTPDGASWQPQVGEETVAFLVSCIGNAFAVTLEGFEDVVGGLRPDEGLGIVVVDGKVVLDGLQEFPGAAVASAPDLLVRDLGEPTFDLVEP